MPYYENRSELPVTIQETLPVEAQDVYIEAYNLAYETHQEPKDQTLSRESIAHQVAWAAVTREFVHDDKTGKWHREGEEPVPEEEAHGLFQKIRQFF